MIGLVIKSTGKNSLVKAKNKVYKCNLRGNFRLENNFSNPIVLRTSKFINSNQINAHNTYFIFLIK